MTDDLLGGLDNLPPQIDPDKDYFKELTGPGGKFHDPDEKIAIQKMARGKVEADNLIEIFKREKDQLRSDYLKLQEESKARAKLEDYINSLSTRPASSAIPEAKVDNTKPKELDLDELISKKMADREVAMKRKENYQIVENKLKETFGDQYPRILEEKVKELGLTREYINDLARTSPEAFFRTMYLKQQEPKETFQAPYRSNQRSDNFGQKGGAKRTWSYYQELKKADPKVYYDPKTTNQMQKDYALLGKSFEDGDFSAYGDGI